MSSNHYSVRFLLARLLKLLWLSPATTAIAGVSILTSIGFSLAMPLLIRALIDAGVVAGNRGAIFELGTAIVVVTLLASGSAYARGVSTQWVGVRVSYELRKRLVCYL